MAQHEFPPYIVSTISGHHRMKKKEEWLAASMPLVFKPAFNCLYVNDVLLPSTSP